MKRLLNIHTGHIELMHTHKSRIKCKVTGQVMCLVGEKQSSIITCDVMKQNELEFHVYFIVLSSTEMDISLE